MSSRPAREQRGFTLLELTIAMMFVAVLVGGIVLSISTCLKVWERTQETADLNQEARAVFAVLARDIRGSYLGLHRTGGYFLGHAGASRGSLGDGQELLELTTESSTITRAALLPAEASGVSPQPMAPPVTDFVAVRYELLRSTAELRGGLYRTVWVAPVAEWLEERRSASEAMSDELVSESIIDMKLRYFDDVEWLTAWATTEDNLRLPEAIAIELTLLDARENEHVYRTVLSIPTS
jgi:type II secretory pathway pseudopilin PulG